MANFEDKYDWIGEFHQGVAIIKKNLKYGLISMEGEEILPSIYDKIDEVDFYMLDIVNGRFRYDGKETSLFICRIHNGKFSDIVGLFNGEEFYLPLGKYEDIISVNYNYDWSFGTYVKNEYGIDSYRRYGGTRVLATGWLVVKRGEQNALYYNNKLVLDFSSFDVTAFDNCPLFLKIKIDNRFGIISPDGWVIKPEYEQISRIRWRKDEVNSYHLKEDHFFLVDNDVYYSSFTRDGFFNEVVFGSDGKYKYYREKYAPNDTILQFIRLWDSRIMELNIPWSCKVLKDTFSYYSELL